MTTPNEIWASRLQKEILTLTQEVSEDKKDVGILPEFIKYHAHELDISRGTCNVSFAITVEGIDRAPSSPLASGQGLKAKVDAALGGEEEHDDEDDDEGDDEAESAPEDKQTYSAQIIVTFDASRTNSSATSYPFFKPKAILMSGAEHFTAVEINNGDQLYIDCDWTPSLHLNDAALNIALKIRESIKRGEPCLKIVQQPRYNKPEDDLLQEVKKDISKAGAKVSSFFSDLKNKASAVAEELDHAVGSSTTATAAAPPKTKRKVLKFSRKGNPPKPIQKIVSIENITIGDEIDLSTEPWNRAVGMYPCKAIRRPAFVSSAMETAGGNNRDKVRSFAGNYEEEDCEAVVVNYGIYGQQQCSAEVGSTTPMITCWDLDLNCSP